MVMDKRDLTYEELQRQRDLALEELRRAGLPPILNYSVNRHPNFGSIVWTGKAKGNGQVSIGMWRLTNRSFTVSLAYGFQVVADRDLRLLGAGHGEALAIKSPDGSERYYPWGSGTVDVDRLLMPAQALIDFGTSKAKNRAQYFHYPDLMWFDPYPTNEVMDRATLLAEIERRLRPLE